MTRQAPRDDLTRAGRAAALDAAVSQLGRGEPIKDTARVLCRQVAAIVRRTAGQQRAGAKRPHAQEAPLPWLLGRSP